MSSRPLQAFNMFLQVQAREIVKWFTSLDKYTDKLAKLKPSGSLVQKFKRLMIRLEGLLREGRENTRIIISVFMVVYPRAYKISLATRTLLLDQMLFYRTKDLIIVFNRNMKYSLQHKLYQQRVVFKLQSEDVRRMDIKEDSKITGLASNNANAEIRQYKNIEELERLKQVQLLHMLTTEKLERQ